MKRVFSCLLLLAPLTPSYGAIERVPLKTGWKFVKADDPAIVVDHANYSNEIRRLSGILDRAYKGDFSGALKTDWCKLDFDDSKWTDVRVPHDWGVMKPYDPELPYGDGFLDVSGIGERKAGLYGQIFMGAIRDFEEDNK